MNDDDLKEIESQIIDAFEADPREKMAQAGAAYIRDRLRAQGALRRLFPPQQIPDEILDAERRGT